MKKYVEIEYREIEQDELNENFINQVIEECFKIEKLEKTNLYISIILTTPSVIRKINKQYRNIDKETDVLSFPMFEKDEIHLIKEEEALGDIIISVERVKQQAIEYGHSFERELSYMLVHGFYHLMGEDHINDTDKQQMRKKEENVLCKLKLNR